MTTIGFLHPGAMGASLAATVDAERLWVGRGRSAATATRAAAAGLVDSGGLAELCRRSDAIVSICPPAAARAVAESVARHRFAGHYVEANAIAPTTSGAIGELFGDRFVDGGVIGPPAERAGTTRFYLAGPGAGELAGRWAGSALEVVVLADHSTGAPASALKMAYAAWTKGSAALLLSVAALAEAAGVSQALGHEWTRSQPGLIERVEATAAGAGPKAWRWAPEMAEIAATMAEAGLPDQFHRAAELVFRQLEGFKGVPRPSIDDVVAALLDPPD